MFASAQHSDPRLIIIGDYLFDPGVGLLSGPSGAHYICPQLTTLLGSLVEHAGEVVSSDQLDGSHDDVDYSVGLGRRVGRLRHYFRDSPSFPSYIESFPGQGYRLIAPVYGSTTSQSSRRHQRIFDRDHARRGGVSRFLQEFGHRKVSRAMLIYTLVIWVVFQMTEIVVPALTLPDWVATLVVVLGILGFPVAATLSWLFDLTPSGLVRGAADSASVTGAPRTRTEYAVDFALVAAAIAICSMLVVSSQPGGPIRDVSADSPVPVASRAVSATGA